jgi:hypothetical protein
MPHRGPSSPAHPTIKKKKMGVDYFETKGTKPSIIVDLIPYHCQTTSFPFSRNQR